MHRVVEFASEDGTILRGPIHAGKSEPAPGIAMSRGSGVQLQIEPYAEYFAEAGFAVVLYDHRGFGLSDGAPRREVNPYVQLPDWRDAISFAATQPETCSRARR
jgi:uncharacterized protein